MADGYRWAVEAVLKLGSGCKQEAIPELIREIIHRRWEIENTGFHELKGNWNMEHCYIHQEVASQAILWFMLLAVNLFWLFLGAAMRTVVSV